jgi:predicted kinase
MSEAVLLIGVQGSGKSTFYKERFFDTHLRIGLDLVGTRRREALLIAACLAARQPFVVDNTNTLAAQRAGYIASARAASFRVSGYYFVTELSEAIRRNRARPGKAAIPVAGLVKTFKRLEAPGWAEGFDALFTVRVDEANRFVVAEAPWPEAPTA